MNKKVNVSNFDYCFGCGVCAVACKHKAITMQYDKEGFYHPVVDQSACVDCGICLDVCSFNHDDVMKPKEQELGSYAAWSKDRDTRIYCTSGGLSYEFGKKCIGDGYQFCGVRYNVEKKRSEHYLATTVEELAASKQSKYIQSWSVDAFQQFKRGQKYLVTGVPCQIDSLRRYLRKFKMEDDFILLDFFCHGIPSKWMFDQYLKYVEKKVGKASSVTWRNTIMPDGSPCWQESTNVNIRGERGLWQSRTVKGDIFFCLFFQEFCNGRHCHHNCRFRMFSSAADIRLCDLWGGTYKDNKEGVSGVMLFSEKANRLFESLDSIEYKKEPKEIVGEGQMAENVKPHRLRNLSIWMLRHHFPVTWVNGLRHVFSYVYRTVK